MSDLAAELKPGNRGRATASFLLLVWGQGNGYFSFANREFNILSWVLFFFLYSGPVIVLQSSQKAKDIEFVLLWWLLKEKQFFHSWCGTI